MSKVLVIRETVTINPAGAPNLSDASPPISQPSVEVVAIQDPSHDEADFMSDLSKATRPPPPS